MRVLWQVAYLWVAWIFVSVLRITYKTRPTKVQWRVCAACMPVLLVNGGLLITGLCEPGPATQTLMILAGLVAAYVLVRAQSDTVLHGALLATLVQLVCMIGLVLANPWNACAMISLIGILFGLVTLLAIQLHVTYKPPAKNST